MKKMKLILLMILPLAFGYQAGLAQQFSSDFWHEGEIDLTEGETLRGKVKYDLENDIVQIVTANGLRRSFNPRKVDAFQFIDELTGMVRVFYTLPFIDEENYQKLKFFELMHEGTLTLLTRERIVERVQNVQDPFWIGGRNMRVLIVDYQYYFMNEKGDIRFCESKLEDVLGFMAKKKDLVKKFAKDRKLKIEEPQHMLTLVSFYNSLLRS